MANTTTEAYGTTRIIPDGSTDWVWNIDTDAVINGFHLYSIQFNPSDTNDKLIVRDSSATGQIIFDSGLTSNIPVIKYYPSNKRSRPYIKASECVFAMPSNAVIYIEHED